MIDPEQFSRAVLRAAQNPAGCLLSADRLGEGGEAILTRELQHEVSYFQAYDQATQKAMSLAYSDGNDSGVAEIESRVPNYPVAQLLYAYAIENLLKGPHGRQSSCAQG